MAMKLLQKAVVEATELVTPRVRAITLKHALRQEFQTFDAGAHVTVHLPDGVRRPYSLCGTPSDCSRYHLGVLLEEEGRGGSLAVHKLEVGDQIYVSYPANSFELVDEAGHHVLIAGGIGVTPILSMAHCLSAKNASFEVHYYGRSRSQMAFVSDLEQCCTANNLHIHPDDEPEGELSLVDLLSRFEGDTHYYCCGPAGMLEAYKSAALGVPEGHVHLEQFGNAVAPGERRGDAFELEIANTGEVLEIGEHQTAIDVLRDRQITVDYSCEGGICGECKQELVAGDIEHLDSYLRPEERDTSVMLCVSRAKGRMTVRLPENSPGMEVCRKNGN